MWAVAAILKNTAKGKIKSKKNLILIPLDVDCKFWKYISIEVTLKNKTNFNLGKTIKLQMEAGKKRNSKKYSFQKDHQQHNSNHTLSIKPKKWLLAFNMTLQSMKQLRKTVSRSEIIWSWCVMGRSN